VSHYGLFILVLLLLPVLLGGIASWFARPARGHGVAMLLLLLDSLTWDTHARPPEYEVHSAVTIAAAPEQVCRPHRAGFSYTSSGRRNRRRRDPLLRFLHWPGRGADRGLGSTAPTAIPSYGESGADA
jgi:hypothetical protein